MLNFIFQIVIQRHFHDPRFDQQLRRRFVERFEHLHGILNHIELVLHDQRVERGGILNRSVGIQ